MAFACNRRHNGLQIENSLAFVSCGVSERVHDYLNFIGLSTSKEQALDCFDTLQKLAEVDLRKRLSEPRVLQPFLCVDNIDFEARVSEKRVEKSSRLFHGSWGYFHVPHSCSTSPSLAKQFCLEDLLTSMEHGTTTPVKLCDFLPNKEESIQWSKTLKAQLASTLQDYFIKPHLEYGAKKGPNLVTTPPPVDRIQMYKPDIMILKLMDASDNSAEGVGQLLEQVIKQMGCDMKDFSKTLRIIEGDVGTCMNFESLRGKRNPSGDTAESLQHILTIPGAAHTLWNYSEAIVSHHFGNEKDSQNTGAGRTWQALGGKDRLGSKKDFSSTLFMIRKVHTAGLVFCLE